MDMLLQGFQAICNPTTLILMTFGTALGILFGALPGITATLGVALCLPLTFGMEPITGFAVLISLYIGGVSGGLISAILLNIPGTGSSVGTTFDGHPLAAKGQGAKALGVGIVFSFLGTLFSIIVLAFFAPFVARMALKFGPVEFFALAFFSITMIAGLSGKSILKGLVSGCLGMILAMVGSAPLDGTHRFTFGNFEFIAGFSMLPALVGLFAIGEVIKASSAGEVMSVDIAQAKIKGFGFSFKEFTGQTKNFIISSLIGTGIGILPGIGGATSNLLAYGAVRGASKHPEKFGTGIIDGVVATETANNATIGGAMVPLLTLGIPGDTITAVLLGAFMVHGLQPGPMLFRNNALLIYSILAAMIIANFMMLALEFGLMRGFVRLLTIPKHLLLPLVLVLCVVGAFSTNNRIFDIWVLLGFGIIGVIIKGGGFPQAPVILGFILGPYVETYLRRGMQFTRGSFPAFFKSPIAFVFIAIGVLVLASALIKYLLASLKAKNATGRATGL
jgi:putative tricarboxylic transport membrane protein